MDTKEFEEILLAEKEDIETTLSAGATKNPHNTEDWETKYPDLNVDPSDKNDMADEVEEFENALGVNAVLEENLADINAALDRIKQGSYGKCEVGGEMIDIERLRANPSARTCIKHSR